MSKEISVKVKPNSSENKIESLDPMVVRIKAPADKGKANKELVKFLTKELGKKVEIKSGLTSRNKIIIVS